jgi:hypothetical protein
MVSDNQVDTNTAPVEQTEVPVGQDETSGDVVKHETYKKTLGEVKNLKAKLAEFEAAKNKEDEQKMRTEKRFEELIVKKEESIKNLSDKLAAINNEMVTSLKSQALERELGGVKKPSYLKAFADFNAISLTAEGEVDVNSLKEVANKFRAEHPDLIKGVEKILPSGSPKPALVPPKVEELDFRFLVRIRMENQNK